MIREMASLPTVLRGAHIHMVGIKGTGMTALAEILVSHGVELTGSDTDEQFYTDSILAELGLPVVEGFAEANLPPNAELVIYSSAWDPATHPELTAAVSRGVPLLTYPEALGRLSTRSRSVAVSGVHGKTTTTAMAALLARRLRLPATVLAGSALSNLGNRCTYLGGSELFIAETCEYRRNFLSFRPNTLVVTSIEADHLDYFRDGEDVFDAFWEFASRLPEGGTLIACADDAGASRLADEVDLARGEEITVIRYGHAGCGDFQVRCLTREPGALHFCLGGVERASVDFTLHVPGDHNVGNATAALAAVTAVDPRVDWSECAAALSEFSGTRRRSEAVGEAAGVRVIDDYAHHPTAIASTLAGLRSFYEPKRLVLDFMSHTFSRTKAMLGELARSLATADLLFLHEIYSSAREIDSGDISGIDLAREAEGAGARVHFTAEPAQALGRIVEELRAGDLFVTMGAGSNWRLGPMVLDAVRSSAGHGTRR